MNMYEADLGGTKFKGTLQEVSKIVSEFYEVPMEEIIRDVRANGNYVISQGEAFAMINPV